MERGGDQRSVHTQTCQPPQVVGTSYTTPGDERQMGKVGTRRLEDGQVRPLAGADLVEGEDYDLQKPLARQHVESGRGCKTKQGWATAHDTPGSDIQAEQKLPGHQRLPDLPQGFHAGQCLGAHDHACRPGVEESGCRHGVGDRRVDPEIDLELICQHADDLVLTAPALNGVEVGYVERCAVALLSQSLGDGQRCRAGGQDTLDRTVAPSLAAHGVDYLTTHQI